MEIHLASAKILQKVLGGYFFDSHCRMLIFGIQIYLQNVQVQFVY